MRTGNTQGSDELLTKDGAGRKSSSVRRAELIQATLDLLDERGPEGVTTATIAQRVGLTQTAIFKHFRSKDEIWSAAMDELAARIGPRMAAAASRPGSSAARLERVIAEYLRLVDENPAMTALLFYRAPPSGDRSLRERAAERAGRLRSLMRDLLLAGQAAGEFDASIDADDGAALIFGMVQGLLVRRHFDRATPADGDVARLFQLLVRGLR